MEPIAGEAQACLKALVHQVDDQRIERQHQYESHGHDTEPHHNRGNGRINGLSAVVHRVGSTRRDFLGEQRHPVGVQMFVLEVVEESIGGNIPEHIG